MPLRKKSGIFGPGVILAMSCMKRFIRDEMMAELEDYLGLSDNLQKAMDETEKQRST